MARLEVKEVSVNFGGVQALSSVGLEVVPGRVTGLIGPNGAGKTTLFNVITGLQSPSSGHVLLDGRDIVSLAPHRRARLGLARTFQRLELFGTLTALENVQMALETNLHSGHRNSGATSEHRLSRREDSAATANTAHALLDRVGAGRVADEPADLLPTGLARLVELARALATSPSVVLLDEPSAGLNDTETDELADVLEDLASEGIGVLLVEHDMGLVMNVCKHVTVMDSGIVIADGDPETIQRDPIVQQAYLGTSSTVHVNGSRHGRKKRDPDPGSAGVGNGVPMLELRDIRAGYGRIEVVHGVSLSVAKGSVLALLGPNGAGKSTLLKVASGQLAPMSGKAFVGGTDSTHLSGRRMVDRGLCAVPEGRPVFPNLTVAENLTMYSYCRKDLRPQDIEEQSYERFPVLKARRRQLAGRLSGGEQQALALARALCSGARVLLLDEISMGLAPLIVADLYERVGRLVEEEEVTVVLVEQFAKMALSLADEAAVMANGRIVRTGPPQDLEDELVESYLGDSRQTQAGSTRPPKPKAETPMTGPVENGPDPVVSPPTTGASTTVNGTTDGGATDGGTTDTGTTGITSYSSSRNESLGTGNGHRYGADAMESPLWLKPFDDGSDLSWPQG